MTVFMAVFIRREKVCSAVCVYFVVRCHFSYRQLPCTVYFIPSLWLFPGCHIGSWHARCVSLLHCGCSQAVYLLECVRNSLDEAGTKLTSIVSVFLVRAAQLISKPGALRSDVALFAVNKINMVSCIESIPLIPI